MTMKDIAEILFKWWESYEISIVPLLLYNAPEKVTSLENIMSYPSKRQILISPFRSFPYVDARNKVCIRIIKFQNAERGGRH